MREIRRATFTLMAFFLAMVCMTSVASADPYKVLWGPNPVPGDPGGGGGGHPIDGYDGQPSVTVEPSDDSDLYGVIVYANTRYNAALLTLGFDLEDSRFTDKVMYLLKTDKPGNAFYTFVDENFFDLDSDNHDDYVLPAFYPGIQNRIMLQGVVSASVTLYGKKNVWAAIYHDMDAINARLAVLKVLLGQPDDDEPGGSSGGGGGGGGGDIVGDVTVDGVAYKLFHTSNVPEGNYQRERSYYGVGISASYLDALSSGAGSGGYDGNLFIAQSDTGNYGKISVFITGTIPRFENGVSGVNPGFSFTDWIYGYKSTRTPTDYTYNGNKYMLFNAPSTDLRYQTNAVGVLDGTRPVYSYYWGGIDGGGGDGPTEDPDPDPDPPTPPKPPVIPDPPSNPIPDPPDVPKPTPPKTPTNPIPDPPELPTPTTDVTDFSADIDGILDALQEHCQHLQTKMIECSEYIVDSLNSALVDYQGSLFDYLTECVTYLGDCLNGSGDDYSQFGVWFNWLGDYINLEFDRLFQYLDSLWSWLDNALDFDFTGVGESYNDSSLMGWLEKIYLKLGEGFNFTPTDPVTNPRDVGSWLEQFLASFFGSLLGNLASVLADAAGSLATLATKFPFCIPWDIMAILGLLASPPVCPVIELPCYALTSSGLQEVGSYDIDLHDIEFAVEGIRWMMKLGFILVLANRTKDWVEMLEGVMS